MWDYIPFNFTFNDTLSQQRGDEYPVYKLFPAVDKTTMTSGLPWPNAAAASAARFRGKELLS